MLDNGSGLKVHFGAFFRVSFRHVELPVLNFEVKVWCFILSSCVILEQGVRKIEQAYF
jgi:hypothetical protein